MSSVDTTGDGAGRPDRRGLIASALLSWLGFCLLAAGLLVVLSS